MTGSFVSSMINPGAWIKVENEKKCSQSGQKPTTQWLCSSGSLMTRLSVGERRFRWVLMRTRSVISSAPSGYRMTLLAITRKVAGNLVPAEVRSVASSTF